MLLDNMEVWLSYDCPYKLAQHRAVQGLAVVNKEILGTIEVACAPPMLSNAYEAVWNQCTIVMALIKQGIQSSALLNIGGAVSYFAFFDSITCCTTALSDLFKFFNLFVWTECFSV